MKLNHECVRDLLLLLELVPYAGGSEADLQQVIKFSNISDLYDLDTFYYTFIELIDGGFVDGRKYQQMPDAYAFTKITYKGHEFLDNIRDDTNWKETKSTIASKMGSASLNIFSSVAAKLIEDKFNL
ncbi:DUF2513 domain-containing protein [Levilactobacillus brevis]|uniref:DUF2513 domain-containing protein n=1 Tax=Levilactobacillus brevis TaxID=1580 RepID=UPI001BA821C2|nr:DUF2513 domain-containing protein [Levilactobacillus brevis]MBS0977434.1 DUF2513 domain-containing protein [Levilactobacillus brevis]MBS1004935.1 DUF2513 domain-containing protein [Levilactobacillus brevis]MBS1012470.1 DUF2513 domain-containing protein [Levilactobacillus brevis]